MVVFNTLNLMDKEINFSIVETPKFVIRGSSTDVEDPEAPIRRELERAVEAYEGAYQVSLNAPVTLKVYQTHDDLGVFAFGLPGSAFHGATYGSVLAIDSPAAHPEGDYRWDQTLWRQLGIALIQTVAAERAPRWFVTGMVEAELPSDMRTMLTADVRRDLVSDGLFRIDGLDRALRYSGAESRRASLLALAGHLCDLLRAEWGQQALLDMAAGFARGETTEEVFEKYLNSTQEEVERRVESSLR